MKNARVSLRVELRASLLQQQQHETYHLPHRGHLDLSLQERLTTAATRAEVPDTTSPTVVEEPDAMMAAAPQILDALDFTPEPTCIAQWCVNSDRPNPADFYVIGTAHAGHIHGHENRVFPECRPCRAKYAHKVLRCECGQDVRGDQIFHITVVLR